MWCSYRKRLGHRLCVLRRIMWGHVEKAAICKQKEEVSRRNQTCQHLDLGLLASLELQENKFLLFKPPNMISFMAELAIYTHSCEYEYGLWIYAYSYIPSSSSFEQCFFLLLYKSSLYIYFIIYINIYAYTRIYKQPFV